ncbi:heterodisulfide reductase-related iron-sulfur binding cluster [Thermodesulfovibrionales bacterium]|nr:heterodisulfide reductase-related iron-sulfur binding cluster [Thermodesulfovibrionales bacterium]
MTPANAIEWGIIEYVIFWGLSALALGLFLRRIHLLGRYLLLGKEDKKFTNIAKRISIALVHVVGQWGQFKNMSVSDRAGLGHAFIAWGFLIFVVYYLLFIIIATGFGISEMMKDNLFFFYYSWVMDIVAPLVIIGAAWGIIRRYIVKPPRLKGEQTLEAMVILVSVLVHPVTHLLKGGTNIALGLPPAGIAPTLPPISSALSALFDGFTLHSLQVAHAVFFWVHWGVVLFVLVYIGYSRYLHMVASPLNVLLQSSPPKGALSPIDLETAETFGVSKITDFTRKQLLDLYSCVACGRCQENCPAYTSGKPLNPKKLIQDLKKHLLEVGPELLKVSSKVEASPADLGKMIAGEVVTEDEIWDCTTCRACQEVCPVCNEHIDKIIDLRRNLALEQASIPETAEGALRSIEARGHPWRGTTATRIDWADGLDIKTLAENDNIDILYWVGCTGAMEDRSMKVAQAMGKLLKLANIKFGILGAEESCCGEPARRLGNEYLFQIQAQKNIELLKGYNVNKIVTACPHCYNTIKNEYSQFGGEFEVVHHTEFIADLLQGGKLRTIEGSGRVVTYQDSCYLGRYNDIYQPPRQILNSMPGVTLVEMEQNRKRGFCCGGGGGHMWLERRIGRKINELRAEQAIETKAQIIATACPFCLQMFEDGIKTKVVEESFKVMDIAELVITSAMCHPSSDSTQPQTSEK